MNKLHEMQNEFLSYLLDNSSNSIVKSVESTPQHSAEQRMMFYGNAYILRLKEALMTDYERLHSYLGDDLFETLMNNYIEKYPSHHPSLRYFGQHMHDLVATTEPYNQFEEITEITRIEQAFANSFDAENCECVTINQLAELEPEAWTTLRLAFHNAVQILPQKNNSFQIWRALSDEETPPEKTEDDTSWLIWRHDLISRYRALDEAELAAIKIAMSNGNFSDLCEVLLNHFSEEETPQRAVGYLQQWINDQMICELK